LARNNPTIFLAESYQKAFYKRHEHFSATKINEAAIRQRAYDVRDSNDLVGFVDEHPVFI
jgi:hypothetical protein